VRGHAPVAHRSETTPAAHDDQPPALLCLCGIEDADNLSRQVLEYKTLLINDILGANIVNALAHTETDRLAHEDSLTHTRTRRVFDSVLASEWERFNRYKSPFCVAFVDVDLLKRINDTHGHSAGDEVLSTIADVLDKQSRGCDTVARYGGDEFALMLPETDVDGAAVVLKRIQESLARTAFSFLPDGPAAGGERPTISIGVACSNGKTAAAEVVQAADHSVYKAKQAGRNQTWVEDGS